MAVIMVSAACTPTADKPKAEVHALVRLYTKLIVLLSLGHLHCAYQLHESWLTQRQFLYLDLFHGEHHQCR